MPEPMTQDTPQNRMVNLLVNLHRMTHRNAWNLLKLLAKSEDFIVGFCDPETMLRVWEKAGRVKKFEVWESFCDHEAQITGRRKKGDAWRIVPDEEEANSEES